MDNLLTIQEKSEYAYDDGWTWVVMSDMWMTMLAWKKKIQWCRQLGWYERKFCLLMKIGEWHDLWLVACSALKRAK